jgi:arsenate reductase
MAEGIIKHYFPEFEVYSAGTFPEKEVNPFAVRAMREIGIDISSHHPKLVDEFTDKEFDYVFTVCDSAKEKCPVFTGKIGKIMHVPFPDPAAAEGGDEKVMQVYRQVRDNIKKAFLEYFNF